MTADVSPQEPDYRFGSFTAGTVAGEASAETTAWLEAAAFGFHQAVPTPQHMARTAEVFESDARVLTGAYAASTLPPAWESTRPVATYGTLVKPLNVGGGGSLDAHLIASVTVRPNHRRRGLMRRLITDDLRQAREDGRAIAALSAMEATIYGRFGFGAATFSRRVEVDTSDRFHLMTSPLGSVEMTDPATLLDLAPTLFDQFHAQTPGSVQRSASYPSKIAGIWAEDAPDPDPSIRVALHYDPVGRVDGYAAYKVLGWEVEPLTIRVVDIVWTSQDAYLGLWDYLASVDLVTRVTWGHASIVDALPWAMADRRGFKVVGEQDDLWLRVLDPVAALQARRYEADADIRIAITDRLAIADGVYALSVRDGQATVTREPPTASGVDVSMDVSALGSLFLGGVRASVLAQTGQLVPSSPAALGALDAVLARRESPLCLTHF